jgi:hypothetical protein
MQTTTDVQQHEQQQPETGNLDDAIYSAFLDRLQARFRLNAAGSKLFTTNVEGLWDVYLDSFLAGNRQYHNCNSCKHFIERFGGVVTIGEDGIAQPAFWHVDDADILHADAVGKMARAISRATVNGVFLSPLPEWGSPVTGVWRHLHVLPPKELVFYSATRSADQAMAEKREDFRNVQRALEEFPRLLVAQALSLLNTETLYGSEKATGPARWLFDLHTRIEEFKGRRTNVVWRAVATAPAGFCHPRSSMIGTLLEDLAQGLPVETVARRFKDKMDPLQYQRPQAPPSAGNIAQAEKLVAGMGIEPSLKRRYARLDEIETIWEPIEERPVSRAGRVFSHLKPKDTTTPTPLTVSSKVMTFEKFRRTLMPTAKSIELLVTSPDNYAALMTAVHPDAPPILQWDMPERRNPFSWYLYDGGSAATSWGLAIAWTPVTAIAVRPCHWYGASFTHQAEGAFFILKGAKDSRARLAGAGLFPGILKSDLHGIRATIEAYSKTAVPAGQDEASACGLSIQKDFCNVRLRVTDAVGTRVEVRLDRWD